MVRTCCVKGCKSSDRPRPNVRDNSDKSDNKTKPLKFFRIPQVITHQGEKTNLLSSERKRKWLKCLNLTTESLRDYMRVCSIHFSQGPSALYDNTNPDWLPTKYLNADNSSKEESSGDVSKLERYERKRRRANLPLVVKEKRRKTAITEPSLLDESKDSSISLESSFITSTSLDESGISLGTLSMLDSSVNTSTFLEESPASLSYQNDDMILPEEVKNTNFGTQTDFKTEMADSEVQTKPETLDFGTQVDAIIMSEFGTQVDAIIMSEFGTQVTNSDLITYLEVGTETNRKEFQESGTETIFRVIEMFELEASLLKVKDLTIENEVLKSKLTDSLNLMEKLESKLRSLKCEFEKVNGERENHLLMQSSFVSNDAKVKFFTGLENYKTLLVLFNGVKPFLFEKSKLMPFQQLILTLMKLRLASKNRDLSYRFGISEVTVGKIFYNCLNVLYKRLEKFIKWPDRDCLQKTMPMCFRENFGKSVAVIIDCFEVFLEKPSNILTKAETWSSYKHQNTVKFLIGITPQGTVSFLSKGWVGRVSDKRLTEECGFLDNLLPGDVVLADRGFKIEEAVGLFYATVKLPAFRQAGKNQLDPRKVEATRKIANVRIHVERVIGTIRQKYTLLHSKLPIELLHVVEGEEVSTIDKIGVVACALTNLCKSVVSFQ